MEAESAHLEPVEGYLSSYGHSHFYLVSVREILVRGAAQSPAVMVALPSFQPESMVYILSKKGQVFVVSAVVTEQIWGSENKEKIRVEQKERLIEADASDPICEIFELATKQARYPQNKTGGVDGTTYYFSSFGVGVGQTAGQTWSPDPHTVCGRLVALGRHMQGYVLGQVSAERLSLEARALLAILKKNTQP